MNSNPFKIVDDLDNCIEILHKKKADTVVAVNRVWDGHPDRISELCAANFKIGRVQKKN